MVRGKFCGLALARTHDLRPLESKGIYAAGVLDMTGRKCPSIYPQLSLNDDTGRLRLRPCCNVLIGCVKATNDNVAAAQASEQLVKVSSVCFCLRVLSHLKVMDPTSRILEDVLQQYTRAFPFETNFCPVYGRPLREAVEQPYPS